MHDIIMITISWIYFAFYSSLNLEYDASNKLVVRAARDRAPQLVSAGLSWDSAADSDLAVLLKVTSLEQTHRRFRSEG